jgi:hypothetical protein
MSQAGKKAVKYPMPNAKKEKNPDFFTDIHTIIKKEGNAIFLTRFFNLLFAADEV